ncbi:MAG: TauD/TfdA family dioxygenase [Acidimicrobiales bacterium]
MTATTATPSIDTRLDVRRLSGNIGAEIRGVDLADLDDETVDAIRTLWLRHKVVFFPDQHLTPDQHSAFASRFGELTPAHPVVPGLADRPEVFEIDYSKRAQLIATYGQVAKQRQGLAWHTDVTFVERPPSGSILNAVAIPPAGGDTMWSNQVAAYEDLSPTLQRFLGELTAVHDGRAQFAAALAARPDGGEWDGEVYDRLDPVEHPVVITHPETGERALFVNPGFTSHIAQLDREESDALLAFLYAHSVRPEFTVRYHWTQGTIGFWDNRVTQHAVVGDFGDQHRVIQRITLRGQKPTP